MARLRPATREVYLLGLIWTLVAASLFVWHQLHYLAIVIGFGLAPSVLFVKYRDRNQVWDVVARAGFFLAPIVYPLRILPERVHFYLYLWPPTPVIMFSRSVLVGGVVPTAGAHALLSGEALVTLALGTLIFRRWGCRLRS